VPVVDTLEPVAIRWVDVVILGGANRREAPHGPRGAEQVERCFRDAAGDEQRDQRQKQIPPMTCREGHDDDGQYGEQPVRSQLPIASPRATRLSLARRSSNPPATLTMSATKTPVTATKMERRLSFRVVD
jgi:hypothetical protein